MVFLGCSVRHAHAVLVDYPYVCRALAENER